MLRSRAGIVWGVVVVAGLGLGGCSTDGTAPNPPRPGPELSVEGQAARGYLVGFDGPKAPARFAASVAALGGTVRFLHEGSGIALVGGITRDGATRLAGMAGVDEVEPDAAFALDDPPPALGSRLSKSDGGSRIDPAQALLFSWQWNMRLIKADKAWARGKLGSSRVTVAILDSGLDYDNPDLSGLVDLSRSTSFIPTDDQITTTFFPTRHPITDYNGHGTNVGAQVSSRAVAFAGVTARTTLIGVKVLGWDGTGSVGGVLAGVLWAADHGADVANMSLGSSFPRAGNGRLIRLTNRVMAYARKRNVLVVVSAGNGASDLDHNGEIHVDYCDAEHVMCVSAVGPLTFAGNGDLPAYYSNFGLRAIDVAAPGGNADVANGFPASEWPWGIDIASWVWSFCSKTVLAGLDPNGAPILTACADGVHLFGAIGTSQAAPHVTGLAALLVDLTGRGNPNRIKRLIEKSADDIEPRGPDPFSGSGRINVKRAAGL